MGIICGSYSNMLIYRLPRKESTFFPRSHCPSCNHTLSAIDLIPLFSYLLLRGKCRYCSTRISGRYFLTELFLGLVFVLVFFKFGLTVYTLAGWLLVSVMTIASFTDIETGTIPDSLNLFGVISGLALSYFTIGFSSSILGLLFFSAILLFLAIISNGGMGGGDIKLAAVIGSFLGVSGSVAVLFIASLSGGIYAIFMLILGRKSKKDFIKFGPFLGIATLAVFLYSNSILRLIGF